jgi:hypothetical protein
VPSRYCTYPQIFPRLILLALWIVLPTCPHLAVVQILPLAWLNVPATLELRLGVTDTALGAELTRVMVAAFGESCGREDGDADERVKDELHVWSNWMLVVDGVVRYCG